ncbi:MAG: hypothetical protein GY717_00290 [Rhodobacteraceae bacterium]|nr:hypothetical protein [Paracoccaceae bacterium]
MLHLPNISIVRLVRVTLIVAAIGALVLERWSLCFVALATLGASMLPDLLARRMCLRLPVPFLTYSVLFIFATLFLGEAFDFYERYWWWDIALHGTSAMGFGLVGFVFIFYLFEGDRYAAPAWAIAFISWCCAVAIGTMWEIFEFTADMTLGTNMLKSGLPDTMGDLIVDMLGALFGAISGYLYMKGLERGGLLAWLIADFVRLNRRLFRRSDEPD